MSIIGLDHLQISMPAGQEDEARAFYGGLLGFSEAAKPPALAARGGCWFARPGVSLHIGVQEPFRPASKGHPAFLVEDLAALRGKLEKAGCVIVEDDALPGVERFYTNDPFGNRLEFMQASRASQA